MRTSRHSGTPSLHRDPVQGARAWLLAWLLLSVCVAPWLARMHQVVHAPRALVAAVAPAAEGAGAVAVAVAAAGAPAAQTGWPGAVHALFGHHASLDCQALDQLAYGQAPQAAFTWLPLTWGAAAPLALMASAPPALRARAAVARGPPQAAWLA